MPHTQKKVKKFNLEIILWNIVGFFWNLRPTKHLPQYKDHAIASCKISDKYDYPEGVEVLFEWDEKGRHWIVFTTKPFYFAELPH